jgi:hypothetical protein
MVVYIRPKQIKTGFGFQYTGQGRGEVKRIYWSVIQKKTKRRQNPLAVWSKSVNLTQALCFQFLMDQLSLSWIDPSFDPDKSTAYDLFLIAGMDGVSFLVRDAQGTIMVLKSWDFSVVHGDTLGAASLLRTIAGSDKHINLTYRKRWAAVSTPWLSLVPNRLFKADALSDYFELLLDSDEHSFGAFPVEKQGMMLLYAQKSSIGKLIGNLNSGGTEIPLAGVLLSGIQTHQQTVFVNIRAYSGQVFVIDRGSLLYFNGFSFDSADDLLYFILLAYDQFRLSPAEVPLKLAGNILENGVLYKMLYRYIRTLEFVGKPGGLRWSTQLQLENPHLYFDLLLLATSPITAGE